MPENVVMPHEHSLLQMVQGSGPVVQGVLFILIILSVLSWAISIAKVMQFRKAQADSQQFSALFWETRNFARVDDSSRRLNASPLARLFSAGYREVARGAVDKSQAGVTLIANSLERAMRRAEQEESAKLERGLTFLATVASAAPFIGLFGTVWGIMNAFQGLGAPGASSTLQAVAPGISEALIATAIGLAAAIPAAVAYNYFVVGHKHFREAMGCFIDDFIALSKEA
jgi:biopolymer transport protein TolQ